MEKSKFNTAPSFSLLFVTLEDYRVELTPYQGETTLPLIQCFEQQVASFCYYNENHAFLNKSAALQGH